MYKSLFRCCKDIVKVGLSSTVVVGDKEVFIEYYTQEDIDKRAVLGNTDQNNVVLIAGDELVIPSGYTLAPANPKKSMVIFCNKLINNGTISMKGKGPNLKPHDWYIIGKSDGFSENVIIPAYANNAQSGASKDGNNGTNRQCGSGGTGGGESKGSVGNSGMGYAFGGGAGSGGASHYGASSVSTEYPMIGSAGRYAAGGGVGNPSGTTGHDWGAQSGYYYIGVNNSGVGGRLIIFCCDFENNGIISADGVDTKACVRGLGFVTGGSSGGGAVDLFFTKTSQEIEYQDDESISTIGNITANGGAGLTTRGTYSSQVAYNGAGGNGCVTIAQWNVDKLIKPITKYMSKENMIYFLEGLVTRMCDNQ